MSTVKDLLETARQITLGGKRVLFVEGSDDGQVYGRWLARLHPLYASRLEIVSAEGRNPVMKAMLTLASEHNVFALLDRDEWDDSTIQAKQAQMPRLFVNSSRHCLESYFCAPEDVEAILLRHDKVQYGPAMPGLLARLEAARGDWVDHWAMWTTAMRLQTELVSEGCASYFNSRVPLPGDSEIQARIASWGSIVDPRKIFATFDSLRALARTNPPVAQYRSHICGKKFFIEVVMPALRMIENRNDWLIDLASWHADVPSDLKSVLERILNSHEKSV